MSRPERIISTREWTVPRLTAPCRLDRFLMGLGIHSSRTFLQRLIREGEVEVNGQTVKTRYRVRSGDRIVVRIHAPTPLKIQPEPIPLDIVYEDSHLLVVNKPEGLVVHPAPGHYSGTLVNALLHHCRDLSGIGGRERPGIVHRLDKGTTGLLLVAKSDAAHQGLSRQFSTHTISRTYWALVIGTLRKSPQIVEVAIGRDRRDRKKISSRTLRPKRAVTKVRIIERFSAATWVEAEPKTGRTHQIRVHLAGLGYPIFGDRTYGGLRAGLLGETRIERPMLHARRLGFIHPIHGKPLEFEVPMPEDMEELVRLLRSFTG